MPPRTPDPMSQIQPGQFAGLLFGVGLVLVVFIVYNFRFQLWAAVIWCAAVAQQAYESGPIRVTRLQPVVNHFEDDDGAGEPDVTSTSPQTGVVPPAVPGASTATCTGDTDFSVDDIPADLTYEEIVTILARQEDAKGNPRWSGKKIYSFVGKNYGEFVALMRVLRPKDTEPAEEPTILTPIAGRPTKASLYAEERPTFRETDPELEFQPPPAK